MYRTSRFGELLNTLPRAEFNRLVNAHESDKYCKGFDSWHHLTAMIYAQLSGVKSLRELETGFNAQVHHHYHLGAAPMKRSTLSDANSQRDCSVFAELCEVLLSKAHRSIRKQVKKQLYILDASPIPLRGLGHEWAQGRGTYRVKGLSVHMVIAGDEQTPVQMKITDPKVTDLTAGRELIEPEAGATYVFDKAYYDHNWWHKLDTAGAFFVTRLKKNAAVKVVKHRKIKKSDQGLILEDSVIEFTHERSRGSSPKNPYYGKTLRRIVVNRPDKKKPIVLVTNDRKRQAKQIANFYKQRWEIELFFKWLKQNLRIKRFLGRSENATKIQIYCAIISYLLICNYRQAQRMDLSLHLVLTLFKTDMFSRPDAEKTAYQKRKEDRHKFEQLQGKLVF